MYNSRIITFFQSLQDIPEQTTASNSLQINICYYLSSHLALGMQELPHWAAKNTLPDCQIASDTHLHKPFEWCCLHFPSHYHHHLVSQFDVRLPAQVSTR